MKCIMIIATAFFAFAAFADVPDNNGVKEGKAPSFEKGERHSRGSRGAHNMGMGGERRSFDPVIRAVMNPKVAEKIGLSDEQKAKFKEFKRSGAPSRELQAKVRDGMEKQIALLNEEKIDEAAVMAVIDEVFEARKQMAKDQMKRMISVKSILTPEQAKKAVELMKEMRSERPQKAPRGPKGGKEASAK